jgi:hypothetical protein
MVLPKDGAKLPEEREGPRLYKAQTPIEKTVFLPIETHIYGVTSSILHCRSHGSRNRVDWVDSQAEATFDVKDSKMQNDLPHVTEKGVTPSSN